MCMEEVMTIEEHENYIKELTDKWVGRTFKIKDDYETYTFTIMRVEVDFRKKRQDMNRAFDDWGNCWFLFELEDALFLKEVVECER